MRGPGLSKVQARDNSDVVQLTAWNWRIKISGPYPVVGRRFLFSLRVRESWSVKLHNCETEDGDTKLGCYTTQNAGFLFFIYNFYFCPKGGFYYILSSNFLLMLGCRGNKENKCGQQVLYDSKLISLKNGWHNKVWKLTNFCFCML